MKVRSIFLSLLVCLSWFGLPQACWAGDFDSLDLEKLPAGSTVSFSKNILLPAGSTRLDLGGCALIFDASGKHRQLTAAHSLTLKEIKATRGTGYVKDTDQCEFWESDQTWHCKDVYRKLVSYALTFDVLKNGSPLGTSVKIACTDESGYASMSISELKKNISGQGMTLAVKDIVVNF